MGRQLKASYASGDSEVVLWEEEINGVSEFELVINGVFIMASYNHLSSELLVRHAVKPGISNQAILIGGLGMGYTVKEACSFSEVNRIDVVEIEPVIVEWNRTWLKELNGNCLEDARIRVIEEDFYHYVQKCEHSYDLISMDIDNGPMMLVNEQNERVYQAQFFEKISSMLKPTGVFAIWSCDYDEALEQEVRLVFGDCTVEEIIEEHSQRQVPYYLYFGRRK